MAQLCRTMRQVVAGAERAEAEMRRCVEPALKPAEKRGVDVSSHIGRTLG